MSVSTARAGEDFLAWIVCRECQLRYELVSLVWEIQQLLYPYHAQ